MSTDNVPLAYCDAVSVGEQDAWELQFQTNAARQLARAMNKRR